MYDHPLGFGSPNCGPTTYSGFAPTIRPAYAPPVYGADPAAANAARGMSGIPLDPNALATGIASIVSAGLQAGAAASQARLGRWQAVTAGVPGVTPPGMRPDYYAFTPGGAAPTTGVPNPAPAANLSNLAPLPQQPVGQAPEAGVPGWVVGLGALAAVAAAAGVIYTLTK